MAAKYNNAQVKSLLAKKGPNDVSTDDSSGAGTSAGSNKKPSYK
jgi:hypothetical protein